MNVLLLATKNCSHCKNFHAELLELGIEHKIHYCEDEPELVEKYSIRHSPNLIVNDEVVFRKQASEQELKLFFKV